MGIFNILPPEAGEADLFIFMKYWSAVDNSELEEAAIKNEEQLAQKSVNGSSMEKILIKKVEASAAAKAAIIDKEN